jgi:hypothetical protein
MSYTINRWNNSVVLTTVQDGTVDQTSTDIQLVGKNYAGYGEIQNETFVHMLENFSGPNQPPRPISGQLWYDSTNKKIKVYTGDIVNDNKVWKILGGAEYGTEPVSAVPGDFWFNTVKNQLNVRVNQDWLVVGPQNAGTNTTQMISRSVLGVSGATSITHGIIAATVDGVVNFIISEAAFPLDIADVDSNISGFNGTISRNIKKGITFPGTDSTGVSENGYILHGTASNALRFGGFLPDAYLRPSAGTLTLPYRVNITGTEGLNVGPDQSISIYIDDAGGGAGAGQPVIGSKLGGKNITFRVNNTQSQAVYPLVIDRFGIRPTNTGVYNVGSANNSWADVYATNFIGIATKANTLKVGTEYLTASANALNTLNTVVVRERISSVLGDNTSKISATQFVGTADKAVQLANPIRINGQTIYGNETTNITITDDTKLPLTGGILTGALTLPATVDTVAYPSANQHAATKLYVDGKFGVGGILGLSQGGTNASTATAARTNLSVPRVDGVGATINSTWNINIAPSLAPIIVTSLTASVNARASASTTTTIVVQNNLTQGSNIPTGPGYSDVTSVTPITVALGSKTWTVNKVSGYQLNTRIKATYIDNPAISMQGVVTSVDNIALTITVLVDTIIGTGVNLNKWSFSGLGDSWREGAVITGTSITGTVTITNVALQSPAAGSTTLTIGFSSQVVTPEVVNITATDSGDQLGGNAASATRARNLSGSDGTGGVQGSIPYQTEANATTFLPIGLENYLLSSTGALPVWKNISNISVGTATQLTVKNRPTEIATFYPMFTDSPGTSPGGTASSAYVDLSTLTYNTNTNTLTIGAPGQPGTGNIVVGTLIGNKIKASGGTVTVLDTGTASGENAIFKGKADSTDKLATTRTFTLGGILKGSQTFDGTGNCLITASYADDFTVTSGSITGNVVTALSAGTYITLNQGAGAYDPASKSAVTVGVSAGTTGTDNLVARDSEGSFTGYQINATLFSGKATSANYADLAEKYLPDAEYEPGTVVAVGGAAEITASTYGDRALGVISSQPAFMMNKDLEGGVYVALKGRVPCKVIGSVRKGQRLVAADNGCAVAAVPHASDVFAIAMETSSDTGVKVIEVAVL